MICVPLIAFLGLITIASYFIYFVELPFKKSFLIFFFIVVTLFLIKGCTNHVNLHSEWRENDKSKQVENQETNDSKTLEITAPRNTTITCTVTEQGQTIHTETL